MHSFKKIIISGVAAVVAAGGGGFWAGMHYAAPRSTFSQRGAGDGGALRAAAGLRGAARRDNGFVSGDIIAKDEKSITVKLRDGGSRIVFFSDATQVIKSVPASAADLVPAIQVAGIGQSNPDGSVSAESLQIRPSVAQK